LAVAQAAGFPLDKVYFHGNNKSPAELKEAVSLGIGRVVVDSFHELDLLDRIASGARKAQDILLRVSPGIDPHTHVYTTTGIVDSKFGFPIQTGDAARAIRQSLAASNLNLRGLHFHLGSPIFELEPYRAATDLVLRFCCRISGRRIGTV
jgi:diaminopimelate decarboxylase